MWQRFSLVWASLFLVLSRALPACGYCTDYLPLSSSELSMRVKQRLISDDLTTGATVLADQCTLKMMSGGTLRITGTDYKGKSWVVWSECDNGFASVWSADLDRNQTRDLIIVSRTGTTGSSWEPGAHLLIVTFDDQRRPVPWQCKGYFEVDRRGVKDILDLDGDGFAEVVQQTSRDGFWITSLYEASDARFKRRAIHGDRTFPLYNKFTFKPNRLPSKGGGRRPVEPNLANDSDGEHSAISLRAISNGSRNSKSSVLSMSNGDRWTPAPESHMAIVLDEPSGRRVALVPTVESRLLLEEVYRRQLPVLVAKKWARRDLVPMLWAKAHSDLRGELACKSRLTSGSRYVDAYLSKDLP
ncbi:MAG: hypothetical protein K2W95_18850 [Candidatus Obscuribacterales bacterium]|nr:hypothetical protein [Candidatus Obscuribacterales bacterium]